MLRVVLLLFAVAAICYTQVEPQHSIWEGVYTAEQANRGDSLYPDSCSRCHGDELEGDEAPALEGEEFLKDWKGLTLGDLYKRIRDSMPLDHPGSITPAQAADLTAFILRRNKVPEGKIAMATNPLLLRQIRIDK